MVVSETSAPESLGQEVARTLSLAIPIAIAMLGEMAMVVVDYVMSGSLGPAAIAAAGLGGQLIFIPVLWAMGALSAVGAVGAQAHGAGRSDQVSLAIRQGFLMATVLSAPCALFYVLAWPLLPVFERDETVVEAVRTMLLWSVPVIPLTLWFTVLRNFVNIMNRPGIVTLSAFVALGVTIVSNYGFMFGNFGLPRMGVAAIGLTASLATFAQFLTVLVYVMRHKEMRAYRLFQEMRRFHAEMFKDLTKTGLPVAFAYIFESGLFFSATVLMGAFETDALAGHNIVMNIASVTFMIPYALSQAATVRVGICIGEGKPRGARNAGTIGIALAILWMLCSAGMMWTQPQFLAGLYLDRDAAANFGAIDYAVTLMAIAAIFQIADGVQVAAAGALRGLKDTKVPMAISALGYWAIGLVGAIILAFPLGYGPVGLWIGMALGLAASSTLLAWRWFALSSRIARAKAR